MSLASQLYYEAGHVGVAYRPDTQHNRLLFSKRTETFSVLRESGEITALSLDKALKQQKPCRHWRWGVSEDSYNVAYYIYIYIYAATAVALSAFSQSSWTQKSAISQVHCPVCIGMYAGLAREALMTFQCHLTWTKFAGGTCSRGADWWFSTGEHQQQGQH